MKKYVLFLVFAPLTSFASQTTFDDFKACYKSSSSQIAVARERAFLDSYLQYLASGKDSDGRSAIKKLIELKPKDKTRISSKWIGIFEGSIDLCCKDSGACTYSFGSASLEKLRPRVERGNAAAIDLVLTYSALVQTDGAESESLADYQKIIRKNQNAVDRFIKKNSRLVEDYSINWLVH